MKENKNKHLRNIAKKIAKLEKEIHLGNNVQVNRNLNSLPKPSWAWSLSWLRSSPSWVPTMYR